MRRSKSSTYSSGVSASFLQVRGGVQQAILTAPGGIPATGRRHPTPDPRPVENPASTHPIRFLGPGGRG